MVVLLEVAVYGLVAVHLARLRLRHVKAGRPPMPPDSLTVLGAGFAGLYAVSAVYSPYPLMAAVRAAQLLVIAGLGYVLATQADRRDLHRVMHCLLGLITLALLVGFVNPKHTHVGGGPERFSWLAVHPVVAGLYMGLAVVIACSYLTAPPSPRLGPVWPRWSYAVIMAVASLGLGLNRTRGALTGVVIAVIIVLIRGVARRHRIDVLAGLAVIVSVTSATFATALFSYYERGQGAQSLTSLNYRTTLWTYALHAWSAQPLSGLGLGATRGVFLAETGLGGGHNAFINVLVDGGAITALVWVLLLAVTAYRAGRVGALGGSGEAALLLGVLAYLVVDSMTTEELGESANGAMVLLYVLAGWVVAATRLVPPAIPAQRRALEEQPDARLAKA